MKYSWNIYKALLLIKISWETEPIKCVYIHREIYFKELVHVVVEMGKFKICKVGRQVRDPRKSRSCSPSPKAGGIPSLPRGAMIVTWRPRMTRSQPSNIRRVTCFSQSLLIQMLIPPQKKPFIITSRIAFNQISGCCAQPSWHIIFITSTYSVAFHWECSRQEKHGPWPHAVFWKVHWFNSAPKYTNSNSSAKGWNLLLSK